MLVALRQRILEMLDIALPMAAQSGKLRLLIIRIALELYVLGLADVDHLPVKWRIGRLRRRGSIDIHCQG